MAARAKTRDNECMKKQSSPKRLSVNKQTLKSLTAEEAAKARGGTFKSISCYNTNCCNSRVCP